MSRKNIFELVNETYDLKRELTRIKRLFTETGMIGSTKGHGLTVLEAATVRERFVKIENGSITDNFHFRNWRLLHRHASGVSPYLPACPCSPC